MRKVYDRNMLDLTYAKALTQNDIDRIGIAEHEADALKPGWYWISGEIAFETGMMLVTFTPFTSSDNDVIVVFSKSSSNIFS